MPFPFLTKRTIFFISLFLLLIGGSFAVIRFWRNPFPTALNPSSYPEIGELEAKNLSFGELSRYFTDLAKRKGSEYAFSVLKFAHLPPNTDIHLLGHAVGDVLYKQKGLAGITLCTNDFRNACSHSIVVGLLLEHGESVLPDISQACRQAPGGSGAYTMCYHGLGHGVLAYTGYDLPKAVGLCKKTGTLEYHNEEYVQCIGGAIMEIISGGGHNHSVWEKQRKIYLSQASPLSPCIKDFMPSEVRPMCFIYLTPYLWEAAGGDIGNPTEETFKKAFTFCDKLAPDDFVDRDACFGGFGKEFIAIVNQRDIRGVEALTDDQLKKMYEWCRLSPQPKGAASCVVFGANSLYWGGENDKSVAIRFCKTIGDNYYSNPCFSSLIGAVSQYIRDPQYKKEFCDELPPDRREECASHLLR